MNRIDEIERTNPIYATGLTRKISMVSTVKEHQRPSPGFESKKEHNFMSWSKRK